MPAAALVDLESLDLSRTVVDAEGVRALCLQRNRFAMLDGILHFDPTTELIVGFKELALSDWWTEDHIPGRPIFPGALQIEGAAQLCTYHFLYRHPELRHKFVGFGGLNDTRFRGIVTPPGRMLFVARPVRVRPTMFTYQAQGFVERKLVLETEILGVIL